MGMEEIWKNIEEYYQVSSEGRVRSLDRVQEIRKGVFIVKKGQILKQRIDNKGYYRVNLSINGRRKTVSVHRLVATAFCPNPDGRTVVDHIDTNRKNNNYLNLKWVTTKENCNNPLSIKHKSYALKGQPKSQEHRRNLSLSQLKRRTNRPS